MLKKLEWVANGLVMQTTEIETNQRKFNGILLKEMFENEDADTLTSLGISDLVDYELFIEDFTIRKNGVIKLDGKVIY